MELDAQRNRRFTFFELPRELRDKVYDNLKEVQSYLFQWPTHGRRGRWVFDAERLAQHTRLVSRQFKDEVEERCSNYISLSISEEPNTRVSRALPPEWPFDMVTNLEISTAGYCWNVSCSSLFHMARWIEEDIARVKALRSYFTNVRGTDVSLAVGDRRQKQLR